MVFVIMKKAVMMATLLVVMDARVAALSKMVGLVRITTRGKVCAIGLTVAMER